MLSCTASSWMGCCVAPPICASLGRSTGARPRLPSASRSRGRAWVSARRCLNAACSPRATAASRRALRVCGKVARASVYRSLKETPPNTIARRPGPVGACSDAELADHIRRQIAASHLHGEGYRKLWARLRFAGVRASPRRVARTSKLDGTPTALRRTISCQTVRAIISRHPITKPRPAAQPRAPSDAPGRAIGELRAAK